MAARGAGGLGLLVVAPGKPGVLRVLGQGWVLVEVGWGDGRAASPPQGLLPSLSVQGHGATVQASGQDGPGGEMRGFRIKSGTLASLRLLKSLSNNQFSVTLA